MKAAVYCHTSHRSTTRTLAAQEARCRLVAQQRGASEIVTVTDQGAPRAAQRPGLTRLLRLVHSGEVGLVVVDEPPRLSRRLADLREISREVSGAGASLVFVSP